MSDDTFPQTPDLTLEDPAVAAPATPDAAPVDESTQSPNDSSASPVDVQPAPDTDPFNAGEPSATDAPAAAGGLAIPPDEAPAPTQSASSESGTSTDAPATDSSAAPLQPTQSPLGEGYPLPTGNPIAHPTTGEPLPTEQQPDGIVTTPPKASDSAPSESAPSESAPSAGSPSVSAPTSDPAPTPEPPASVPAAPTTPDVYGQLTEQGAQIVADVEKLADNAGVVLAARIKTVANAAASLNDMIGAIISESEDDSADELCRLSTSLDSLAYDLSAFIGEAGDADGNSLHDKIEAATQGVEDHLKKVFKKLTGA